MPNVLGPLDPIFYAQETITALFDQLGMARGVWRAFDRTPQEKGSTTQIPVPSSFVAAAAPASSVDLSVGTVTVTFDKWYEVKFKLTDKEISLGSDAIIPLHIKPAARAIAKQVDTDLNLLLAGIPWRRDIVDPATVADITAVLRILADNKVDMDPGMLWMEINPKLQEQFLNLTAFSQQQGAGDTGVNTQITGMLGQKFGFNIFMNQNLRTHTSGTVVSGGVDNLGAVNGAHAAAATSLALTGLSLTQTIVAGDSFSIAGHTQRYVATANLTLAGGAGTLSIAPPLTAALVGAEVVTFEAGASTMAESYVAGGAWHRDAFVLASAPLSNLGEQVSGTRMAIVNDDRTGLSIRSRVYYMPDASEVRVALDFLYATAIADRNKAVVMRIAP